MAPASRRETQSSTNRRSNGGPCSAAAQAGPRPDLAGHTAHEAGYDVTGLETVKDRLIQTALAEPFLTVDEIARRVGTSAPYVRTALSISGLSLGELRRRKAAELAQRLQAQARISHDAQASFQAQDEYAVTVNPADGPPGDLMSPRVEVRIDPEAAAFLGVPASQPLVVLGYLWPTPGGRGHLGEVVTAVPLAIAELPVPVATATLGMGSAEAEGIWRALSPSLISSTELRASARVRLAEVRLAESKLTEAPQTGTIAHGVSTRSRAGWLQLVCVAEVDGRPVAVERVAFDGARYACWLASSEANEPPQPELVAR